MHGDDRQICLSGLASDKQLINSCPAPNNNQCTSSGSLPPEIYGTWDICIISYRSVTTSYLIERALGNTVHSHVILV